MAEAKLKLIKNQSTFSGKRAASKTRAPRIVSAPVLTPEEHAEAVRFKALTAAKAARQAMLHRIMSELQEVDEIEPAA
ncbi:MAG: hypothetical protein KJ077_17205 [Anaerolineae bacterium]|nr:hypothetical protein [Anaerolineae bacterium]